MYFYHGNRHYYLTQIFLNDKNLEEILYANGLVGNYEQLSYSLADALLEEDDFFKLIESELSANEFYDQQSKAQLTKTSHSSSLFNTIQSVIQSVYGKTYVWYYSKNKGLYVSILKTILYGSIKHFFYENRNKYLPQYDWYLINQNEKRKDIMEMLFREFDKLAAISDALKYYQDADDIPLEFLIYLQEITGLSTNNYGNTFSEKQLRSLTKHLIDVWREKGSLFSIELFFACMGIQCNTSELWFDKRLYDSPTKFNNYTKENSTQNFGYYLTPEKPHTVSYEFSPISVNYSMYTEPKPSRVWEYKISHNRTEEEVKRLLGIDTENPEDIIYTYFKSNFILINFNYIGENKLVTKDELSIFKELVNYMLPAFVRTYYGNEYGSTYGNDDWDIFNGVDDSTSVDDRNQNISRPATPLGLFDTKSMTYLFKRPGDPKTYSSKIYDAYDIGGDFVSGSYMVVYDTRFSQYLSNKGVETIDTIDQLATSPRYDVVGGKYINNEDYPMFYDGTNDYMITGEESLVKSDGTSGTLVIKTVVDASEDDNSLTEYYFKDNNDVETRIYPNLFVDDNNGTLIWVKNEGCYDEVFEPGLEKQINWTYKIDSETFPYETFDPPYVTTNAYNLFESSSYNDEAFAVNDLYNDDNSWNGNIQYEYYEYSNPLEYADSELSSSIQITLI